MDHRQIKCGKNLTEDEFSFPARCFDVTAPDLNKIEPDRKNGHAKNEDNIVGGDGNTSHFHSRRTRKTRLPLKKTSKKSEASISNSAVLGSFDKEAGRRNGHENGAYQWYLNRRSRRTRRTKLPRKTTSKPETTTSTIEITTLSDEITDITIPEDEDETTLSPSGPRKPLRYKITFIINRDESGQPTKLQTVKVGAKTFESKDGKKIPVDGRTVSKRVLRRLYRLIMKSASQFDSDDEEDEETGTDLQFNKLRLHEYEPSTVPPEMETEISVVTSISSMITPELDNRAQEESTSIDMPEEISKETTEEPSNTSIKSNKKPCSKLIVPLPFDPSADNENKNTMEQFNEQLIQKILEIFNRH